MSQREYPILPTGSAPPTRPISFVVVHFSDDYFQNILRSECIRNPLNEVITIDNRNNLFYDNLGQAMNAGLDRARHDLVAVVHEDVLLPDGWQQKFESSLMELEEFDPDWGLLGPAGWNEQDTLVGHWSDPRQFSDTLGARSFERVRNLDEHLLILRASSGVRFDDLLPSIHNVGRELYSTLKQRRMATYVINAPTIHKYADENGNVILGGKQSPKIQDRRLPSWKADQACSTEYLCAKWPEWRAADCEEFEPRTDRFRPDTRERLEQPLVLLSRGGSGSRLLSWLVIDAGVFLGNEVNRSGDAMEMVEAVYMGVLNKYLHRADWQKDRVVPRIRFAAASMLEKGQATIDAEVLWGFKLPESMLLLPEIDEAFPRARYLHLIRDPLTTCLRRTHMTARFDNTIGRVAIREAYRYCGLEIEQSLTDSPGLRMAFTTIHQIETVTDYARKRFGERYLEVRFEDLLNDPVAAVASVARWLGVEPQGNKLQCEVNPKRAERANSEHNYSADVEEAVTKALAPLRRKLGYV